MPVLFLLGLAWGGARHVAAAEKCAAVPGGTPPYTLQTFAFCTTTTVTISGTRATITSTTVRKDASGADQGQPPSKPGWDIASDIRVFIDGTYHCGSSTNTVTCTVANLSAGTHQLQTNWVGTKAGYTMFTENYDGFTITLPNLTVSSITPVGTPTANQSFAVQAVITNNGTAPAPSSRAQTVVGVQGSSNAAISGFEVPALAAGSSYTAAFSYTPATAGTYAVNVCADVGGSVAESNEDPYTDNCKTVSVTVSAPAVSPVSADLRGDGANGPLAIAFRQSVLLSWTSTNATGCTIIIPGANPYSQGPTGSMTAGPFETSGTISLTCTNTSGATGSDTLAITVGSAPTPSISTVFAAPSTLTRGEYLTITIVGENFGASPGVLEEMTGYGGTVKNSYVRGEYNKWDLTWSNTQIALRVYPSITQTYSTGANTIYVRVANQFNQRSSVQPVTATVSQAPPVTGSPAPSLTEVYVNPRPGIRGQTATVFFNGVLNADSCAFQYKGTGEAAWGGSTTGSCTSGITFTVPADLPRGLYLLQGRACRNDGTCSEYRQMTGEWQINPSPTEPGVTSGRAVIDGFRVTTPDTLVIPASTSAAPTANIRLTATLRQALNVSLYYPCRAGFNILTVANVQLACNDETTNTFPLSNDSGGFRTAEPNVLASNTTGGGTIELRLNAVGLDGVRVSRSEIFTLAGGAASPPATPATPASRASINFFRFTYGSFTRSHPDAVNQSVVSVPSGASVSFTGSYTLAGSAASDWLDLGCQNDNAVNVTINNFTYCRQGANVPYRNPVLLNSFTAILTNPSTTQTKRVVLVLRVSDRQGIQEASLPLDVLPAASGSGTPPPATGSLTFTADNQTTLTVAADQTATFRVAPQGTIASATFECSYNPGGIVLEFNGQRYCAGGVSSPVPIGLTIFPAQVTFRNPTNQLQQVVAVIKAKDAGGNVIDQKQVVVNVNPLATGAASQTQSQTQSQSQTSPVRSSARPLVRAQNDARVFAIVNNQRFWIPDAQTFEAAGYRWSDVRVVSSGTVGQYDRLRLVREGSDARIYYLTEGGLRREIPNPEVFNSYGNRWEDVVSIGSAELNAYPSVRFMRASGESRVYQLENGERRWVSTAAAFNRISGRWDQIAPVNATELAAYTLGRDIE